MSSKNVRVLIVDDQASIRALLKAIVMQMGAEVAGEASDGEAAIVQYQACKPNIVLMDINMPKMDGVEALKRIVAIDPQVCVIMMTSVNDAEIIGDCLSLGARNLLLKDNNPEIIQQEIRATWRDYIQEMGSQNGLQSQ
jgi:two-component system chemotaxis response regulator CheY